MTELKPLPESGFLQIHEFAQIYIPYSKSSIYRLIKEGKFPQPAKRYSARRVAWAVQDLRQWMQEMGYEMSEGV